MTAPRARRGIRAVTAAAVLAVGAILLSACAGLPTSGPVFAGLPPGAVAPPDFSFVPLKPQEGASPEQIVQGFIDAGIGPESNWAVAQMYLAPSFRDEWKPNANTTLDDRAARIYTADGDRVALTVTQEATVDAAGAYRPSDGGTSTLNFRLEKVAGQWRISDAPDGIVLGADQFTSVYREYPLMFFDPSWRYLVPDVRWFPSTNAATRIAKTLVDGKPSPWLVGAVVSAFPDSVALDPPSVPISAGGVAQVEMSGPVLALPSQTLNRMQTQLEASLGAAGVSDVEMVYAGTALTAHTVPVSSTRVDPRALVDVEKGFGFLSAADKLEAVPGVSAAMADLAPASAELAADYSAAAVRTATGQVMRVPAEGAAAVLDARPDLIDPSVDSYDYIWSVPERSPGLLTAYSPKGEQAPLAAGAWSNAARITAMTISRDGTRIAALLTVGGQPVVEVFGIIRDGNGVPQSLGDAVQVAKLAGDGIDLTWIDDSTLGVLARTADGVAVIRQIVGGPGSSTGAPDESMAISGTSATTVRLRGAGGTLYAQRGSNWEQATGGVSVLGRAQGMPQ